MKTALLLSIGLILGVVTTLFVENCQHLARAEMAATKPAVPIDITLYRFELNPDKVSRFEEWVKFEQAHHAETVATLEREKMYFEAIFRDRANQQDVIYWLAIHGRGGDSSETSPLGIDQQYQQFMRETLKKGSRTTLSTEYALVPQFIEAAVDAHQ
jgi:Family of unknown function (DUF6176)